MKSKQHKNGDVSYWFEGKCYAIKFAGDSEIYYFTQYEQGRWIARAMTSAIFNRWFYGSECKLWFVEYYCKADEFDLQEQEEMIKYVKGGVL